MLWDLIWIVFIGAAAWQAWRAWGGGSALGTVLLLWVVSWLPLGWILSLVGATLIGYRAEQTQGQLTVRP